MSICPYAEGHLFLKESNLKHKQYKVCIDFDEVHMNSYSARFEKQLVPGPDDDMLLRGTG
jgi:hypothetical protein